MNEQDLTPSPQKDIGHRDINPDYTERIKRHLGYPETETEPQVQTPAPPKGRRRNPLLGPLRGDSEDDTEKPIYHEEPVILSEEQKQTGRDGVDSARIVLRGINPDNSGN